MKLPLTTAILAGGLSERFGQAKTRARLGDRELIDFAISLARQISETVINVHGDRDDYAEKNIPHVADAVPRCGPIGGVYTALKAADTSLIATLPADVPLLSADIYRCLWQYKSDTLPTVAVSHKGLEPLIAILPVELASSLKYAIDRGEYGLYQFFKKQGIKDVRIEDEIQPYDPDWFLNINYPDDLSLLKRKLNLD